MDWSALILITQNVQSSYSSEVYHQPFTFVAGVYFFPKDDSLDAEIVEMIWAQILQQVRLDAEIVEMIWAQILQQVRSQ